MTLEVPAVSTHIINEYRFVGCFRLSLLLCVSFPMCYSSKHFWRKALQADPFDRGWTLTASTWEPPPNQIFSTNLTNVCVWLGGLFSKGRLLTGRSSNLTHRQTHSSLDAVFYCFALMNVDLGRLAERNLPEKPLQGPKLQIIAL